MATFGKPCTSGTLQAALLLVALLAETCAVPGAHAQLGVSLVNLTFVNHLEESLTVTLPAPPLGPAASVTIPPGGTADLKLQPLATILTGPVLYEVANVEYSIPGGANVIARILGETGTVTIDVSTPCESGQSPGLQIDGSALGVQTVSSECAVPTA